jgi:flagellar hook protein FlgE
MAGGSVTPHFPRNIQVFDALGTGHDFRLSFLKIGVNTWAAEFYALDPTEISGNPDGLVASGTITFNGDGSLNSVSTSLTNAITIPWTTGAVDNSIVFDFGTSGAPSGTTGATVIGLTDGVRQFDASYSVEFIEQNGVAAGQFNGITVSEDGTISANFSNGEIKAIYKLPIITVASQNALSPQTGNTFAVTQNSGEVNLKDAGQSGAGIIVSGSLEGSTADIAEELTRTIGIQSNYNANATLISTVRDMEEELNRRL